MVQLCFGCPPKQSRKIERSRAGSPTGPGGSGRRPTWRWPRGMPGLSCVARWRKTSDSRGKRTETGSWRVRRCRDSKRGGVAFRPAVFEARRSVVATRHLLRLVPPILLRTSRSPSGGWSARLSVSEQWLPAWPAPEADCSPYRTSLFLLKSRRRP